MRIREHNIYNRGPIFFLLLLLFSSCIDETFTNNKDTTGSFISIRGISTRAATHPGTTPDDYVVETLRILAFDKLTGNCLSNARYNVSNGDIIQHPIDAGNYDFVFLANEPPNIPIINQLDGIAKYEDLNDIAYPERYFASDLIIPMKQEIQNVTVLPNGQGARLSDNSVVTLLQLALDRLAVRVDVVLEAEDDLDSDFTGIVFENIPNLVPITANYNGTNGTIERNITRAFTKVDDGSYFSDETPTDTERKWAKGVNRIILPANELENVSDKDKAVVLIINMGNIYSPSCELKIISDPANYSLPINTKLDFHGIIKEPLQVNIKASMWEKEGNDWNIDNQRILNVSHINASITDFNGARISFWSNMPVVRVLPEVLHVETGDILKTNRIFNSLAYQITEDGTTAPERFMYTKTENVNGTAQWSGAGYMDLLADGWVEYDGHFDYSKDVTGTYKLILSAENEDGSNALQREITVRIDQKGYRPQFFHPAVEPANGATGYAGAFWKNGQRGERIITGQYARKDDENGMHSETLVEWSAWVEDEPGNMVVLSTTPSMDLRVGTSNPGNAEDYLVTPNSQKGETGKRVTGKGRIYFRIGLTGTNPTNTPRYATVKLSYRKWGWGDHVEATIYLRQGETPDYLFSGRTGSRAFSVYNMTHSSFVNDQGASPFSIVVNRDNATEVDFPTKSGAHFQWARLKEGSYSSWAAEDSEDYNNFGYRALNPRWDMNAVNLTGWGRSFYKNYRYLVWDNGNLYESYSTDFEICPRGYHRPNDGSTLGDIVASHNNTQEEANASEWRASIFKEPMTGDGNGLYDPNNTDYNENPPDDGQSSRSSYYAPKTLLDNMTFGFYADGYFDRRPIERAFLDDDKKVVMYGVTMLSANAAYWGTVFFNEEKSLFFPSAGRRDYGTKGAHEAGILQHPSGGFYMTASAADVPESSDNPYADWTGVWNMEISITPAPVSSSFKNGYSLRCVKNE